MDPERSTDPRPFLPLHPLEHRILLVLASGERHGYRIVREIEARDAAWTAIFPANLYRRIRDLRSKGLIARVPAPASHEGRPRKYYALTPLGETVARAEAERLERLVQDSWAALATHGPDGD